MKLWEKIACCILVAIATLASGVALTTYTGNHLPQVTQSQVDSTEFEGEMVNDQGSYIID